MTRFARQAVPRGIRQCTAGVLLSLLATTPAQAVLEQTRSLSFRHMHTNERLDIVYWRDGEYVPAALAKINHLLRDFRTGDEATMDTHLLDLLYRVHQLTRSEGVYEIISAYRSPTTNEMLRSRSADSGVAKHSQHMLGKAIDLRLTDVPIERIRAAAYNLGVGGIGFYADSGFVHLDTGRFRTW